MATNRSGKTSYVARTFQRGITAFKSQDYHCAIEYFSQAFEALSTDQSISLKINLLDSRAAAKEKINDLKGSLSDARKVIDLAPQDPKGYVRAARLFNKIGRFPASVKMFELAIAKSSLGSKNNAQAIQDLNAELQQVRFQQPAAGATRNLSGASKTGSNSLGSLPFEIFITIVTLLDIPTRFRCMGVCSAWRHAILNTPNLWNSLSLNSFNHQKLMTKAKFWLNRLGPDQSLQTLTIQGSPAWPPSTIHELLSFLTPTSPTSSPRGRIRSFSFYLGGTSHTNIYIQRIFSDVMAFAHSNRNSLRNLDLQMPAFITCTLPLHSFLADFPLLESLRLQGGRDRSVILNELTLPTPENQLRAAPSKCSLETLSLKCCSFAPSQQGPIKLASLRSLSLISTVLTAASLDDLTFSRVLGLDFTSLLRLEHLDLCRVANGEELWTTVWRACQKLPALKRLRLEGLPHFIPHFLELANTPEDWTPTAYTDSPLVLETEPVLPELECLSLSALDSSMAYKFLAVFGYQLVKLESLSVAGLLLDSTTQPLLINALQHLPSLLNINLSNTHATTEVIDAISTRRLQHLQLANCTRVTFRSLTRVVEHNLTFLDITGCHLISTREMIEWLAQRVKLLTWQGQNIHGKFTKRLFLD